MQGIQFPTDPMMDHFLSSVCVEGVLCVKAFACTSVCVKKLLCVKVADCVCKGICV